MNTLSSILKYIGGRLWNLEGGSVSGVDVPSKGYTDMEISFSKTFTTTPTVVACFNSSSTSSDLGMLTVTVMSITKTGATLRLFNASSAQRSPAIRWIAIV